MVNRLRRPLVDDQEGSDKGLGGWGFTLILTDVIITEEKTFARNQQALSDTGSCLVRWLASVSVEDLKLPKEWSEPKPNLTEPRRVHHGSVLSFATHAAIRALSTITSKLTRDRIGDLASDRLISFLKNLLTSISGCKKSEDKLLYLQSPFRMRSDVLNLLSMLATSSKKAQDMIASDGCLFVIMSQTHIDLNNPLMRERAFRGDT